MKSKKKYIYILLFSVFMILMHIYIQPNFGDEIHFGKKLIAYHYDLLSLLTWRWMHWSSRFILEFPMYILSVLPSIVWKFLDCICFIALFYIMSLHTKEELFLLACLCSYPLMHLASAGWIATTTNYLWPFTIGWIAFCMYIKMIQQKNIKVSLFLLYSLMLIYATNSELIACLFLLGIVLFFIYDRLFYGQQLIKNIRLAIWSLCLSVAGIINVLICPGNEQRIAKEIIKWMPQYKQLSFFRKLEICVVSTIEHFTSIPNIIFLLLGFLVAYIMIKEHTASLILKGIGLIPLILSVLLTLYFSYFEILRKHNLNYVLPSVNITSHSFESRMQMILFLISVVYLICVLISIFYIFYDRSQDGIKQYEQSFCLVSIYFGGLISRFTLLFSPTMLASGTRIYFIFYMAQIWVLNQLFEKIKSKPLRIFCYFACLIGIIMNVIMVYMLQQKYA